MFRKIKSNILIVIMILFLSVINLVYAADTISKYEQELEAVKQEQQENAKNMDIVF